jgi:hypothetical protein
MDRAERIGTTVSAAGHASLVAWALIGGIFFQPDENPAPSAMSVSTVSASEFDAMLAAAPRAVTEAPVTPAAPPETETVAPAPEAEVAPDPVPPVAAPEPQPDPDSAPDVTAITPPDPVVAEESPDEPPSPVAEPDTPVLQIVQKRPRPKPAPVVAPVPNEAPEPDAAPSEQVTAAAEPVPTDEPVIEEPPVEEAAPQETGQVLETEENRDVTDIASSPRPRSRPAKPAPAEEPQAEDVAAAEPAAPEETATDEAALAAALEEAMAGEASDTPVAGAGTAANGPPLTFGEKDALRADVQRCWNQGAISTDATRVVVTVRVQMSPDGRPGGMELLSAEGGDDTAVAVAFRTARSAISRCGANGYALPAEKYEQWKVIDMIFDNKEGVR